MELVLVLWTLCYWTLLDRTGLYWTGLDSALRYATAALPLLLLVLYATLLLLILGRVGDGWIGYTGW